jgi:hypothetical protein
LNLSLSAATSLVAPCTGAKTETRALQLSKAPGAHGTIKCFKDRNRAKKETSALYFALASNGMHQECVSR